MSPGQVSFSYAASLFQGKVRRPIRSWCGIAMHTSFLTSCRTARSTLAPAVYLLTLSTHAVRVVVDRTGSVVDRRPAGQQVDGFGVRPKLPFDYVRCSLRRFLERLLKRQGRQHNRGAAHHPMTLGKTRSWRRSARDWSDWSQHLGVVCEPSRDEDRLESD